MGCDFEGESLSRESWYGAVADLQVSDGPDHRKKNCSTANKINQHKHLNQSKFATTIFLITLRCFVTSFQKLWPISPRSDSSRMMYATLDMTCIFRLAKVEEFWPRIWPELARPPWTLSFRCCWAHASQKPTQNRSGLLWRRGAHPESVFASYYTPKAWVWSPSEDEWHSTGLPKTLRVCHWQQSWCSWSKYHG